MARKQPAPSRTVRPAPLEGLRAYLAALRDFDRNVHLFLTVTAFRGMVIAIIGTILNLYLYSLGYHAGSIGLINAANSIAVLVTSPVLGYLADRIGQRPVMVAGAVAYPLTIFGLAFASSTPTILLFNFLFGAVSSAYWVAGIPLLVASTREGERVQVFSINSFLLWGLGPLGAFLSGELVVIVASLLHVSASSSTALRAGIILMGVLAATGAVPYIWLREPVRVRVEEIRTQAAGHIAALFARLLIPDVLIAFGQGAILTFIQLYFHLRFAQDPGHVGLIITVAGIVAGAGTLATPLVAQRWGNLRTAVWLQWAAAPFMVVLALAGQLALAIVAYCLLLTLRGMIDPAYTAFVQEQAPEGYRARLTGMYSVTYSIGFSLGPAASGQLQQMSGFTPAFLLGSAVYVTGTTLLYVFFGWRRRGRE